MLAYIGNFVKSLSLTFLTQPPHFCKVIYDGDTKKNKKANHLSFAYMYFFVSFKVRDKVVNKHSTYI